MKTAVKPQMVEIPAPTVLRDVSYEVYLALRDAPRNDHLRMVYYDGAIELLSPEYFHELPSRRLGIVVLFLTLELDIPYQGSRSTTFRRGSVMLRKGHGKEPDESLYFANLDRILGKETIDLDTDPPPDLWIEVDNRASSQGRLPLYAALGVPEVWRHEARRGRIWFGRLIEGRYEAIDRSVSLPMLTPALLLDALALGEGISESEWIRRLRIWISERFAPEA